MLAARRAAAVGQLSSLLDAAAQQPGANAAAISEQLKHGVDKLQVGGGEAAEETEGLTVHIGGVGGKSREGAGGKMGVDVACLLVCLFGCHSSNNLLRCSVPLFCLYVRSLPSPSPLSAPLSFSLFLLTTSATSVPTASTGGSSSITTLARSSRRCSRRTPSFCCG